MNPWALLNSQFVLLLLGFIFTSVVGGVFARKLQERSWHRQTRLELFRKRYDEGVALLNHLSILMGQRSFALQRLLWSLADADGPMLNRLRSANFRIVSQWNAERWNNRNKVRLLIGEEQANAFLDYRDEYRVETPRSIHYTFVAAHNSVVKAMRNQGTVAAAQEQIDRLNVLCTDFLEHLTTEFAKQANRLELLQDPELPSGRVAHLPTGEHPSTAREFVDVSRIRGTRRRNRRSTPQPVRHAGDAAGSSPEPGEGSQ